MNDGGQEGRSGDRSVQHGPASPTCHVSALRQPVGRSRGPPAWKGALRAARDTGSGSAAGRPQGRVSSAPRSHETPACSPRRQMAAPPRVGGGASGRPGCPSAPRVAGCGHVTSRAPRSRLTCWAQLGGASGARRGCCGRTQPALIGPSGCRETNDSLPE